MLTRAEIQRLRSLREKKHREALGLFVIATVLKNQSAYLAPALIFCLLDTFIPFGAGAEIGRSASSRPKVKPAADTATPKSADRVPTGAGAGTAT